MIILIFLLLFSGVFVFGEALPQWFTPLREAIYEQQLTANQIVPVYQEISARARDTLTGADLYLMLSRCEYMMGRAYAAEERNNEARRHFDEGINLAQRSLDLRESAEAWVMLAENISQNCTVRPASYAMANGLNVEKFSKNALALNSRNAAAQFMVAARWVFAPAPFHNYNRGITMLTAIPDESDMQKDDMFNVYSSLGYAYIQRKNAAQARVWLTRALEIYPTNKYAQSLLAGL